MLKRYALRAAALMAVMALAAGTAFGADLSAIKERMRERLPIIKSMKAAEVIGENNHGYLEFLGENRDNASVVKEENDDRRSVYEAIARQQNTTIDVVERHRAAQIEQKAGPGEWLQDANGNWYKKGA